MKKALIIFSFLCLFISAFFYINNSQLELEGKTPKEKIIAIIAKFKFKNKPLQKYYYNKDFAKYRLDLSEPQSMLPNSHRFPFSEIKALEKYIETCKKIKFVLKDRNMKKAYKWEKWQTCKHIKKLPENFWEKGSLIHPFGGSYAKRGNIEDKSLYHMLEKKNQYDIDLRSLYSLKNSEEFIVSKNALFILKRVNSNKDDDFYNIYSLKSFNDFLKKSNYILAADKSNCIVKGSTFCFQKNNKKIIGAQKKHLFFIFLSSLIIFIVSLHSIYRASTLKKKEQESKMFLIKMLTHELRSPVTSVKLIIESLRSQYDNLPEQAQVDFLNLTQEVSRLKLVVDASAKYLKTTQNNSSSIASINDFFKSSFQNNIKLKLLNNDCSADIDPYWLQLISKTLVENALEHGISPVTLALSSDHHKLIISVRDSGHKELNLKEISSTSFKDSNSEGLGLGLNMIRSLIMELKGNFYLKNNPTEFVVELKVLS